MSSDDFVCEECGEIGTWCCGYAKGCECGVSFCCEECAEDAGLGQLNEDGEKSCNYCNGKSFTEEDILDYALVKLNTTKVKLVEEMGKDWS